jgi:hypothetical protein
MSVAPVFKGTCIAFDETNVRYSYVSSGIIHLLDNCIGVENNIVSSGYFWHVYPNIRYYSDGKCIERIVAVQESGELCCFVSKFDLEMNAVEISDTHYVEAGKSLLVVDGSVMFNNISIQKYNMIRERDKGFVVEGRARAIEIR